LYLENFSRNYFLPTLSFLDLEYFWCKSVHRYDFPNVMILPALSLTVYALCFIPHYRSVRYDSS
jgi:hypothetical protein